MAGRERERQLGLSESDQVGAGQVYSCPLHMKESSLGCKFFSRSVMAEFKSKSSSATLSFLLTLLQFLANKYISKLNIKDVQEESKRCLTWWEYKRYIT